MSVAARLRELAERIPRMPVASFSERETERYLVEPFLDALGYDSRNPDEVQSQLPIQIGSTTRHCDYAVKLDDEVKFLIECKKPGVNLDSPGQLASYFSQVDALFGVYTNGLEYRFYADWNQGRFKRMDSDPFLILDLSSLDEGAIRSAARCSRGQLGDADGFRQWVEDLRCTRVIAARLHRELMGQPSDGLVRLAMGWAGVENQTPEAVARLSALVKDAARSILNPALEPLGDGSIGPIPDSESRLAPKPAKSESGWFTPEDLPKDSQAYVGFPREQWCSRCKTVKAGTDFYRANIKQRKLSGWCKACNKAHNQTKSAARRAEREARPS